MSIEIRAPNGSYFVPDQYWGEYFCDEEFEVTDKDYEYLQTILDLMLAGF